MRREGFELACDRQEFGIPSDLVDCAIQECLGDALATGLERRPSCFGGRIASDLIGNAESPDLAQPALDVTDIGAVDARLFGEPLLLAIMSRVSPGAATESGSRKSVPVGGRPLLHRAGHEPTDEVALSEEEEQQHRQRRQERARHNQGLVDRVVALE